MHTKAKAPEPVIPAHLLNKNKNKKPKRTEKRNVEGNATHMAARTHETHTTAHAHNARHTLIRCGVAQWSCSGREY